MAKNSRNELQAARKAKAQVILANAAKQFNLWARISDFVTYGMLFSIDKDNAQLSEWLQTGYIEIIEPEPCEKEFSPNLSDPNRVALRPTEKGLIAYYWFTRYSQQCRETESAYIQGKKDVAMQLFSNIADSVGLDFDELCATDE